MDFRIQFSTRLWCVLLPAFFIASLAAQSPGFACAPDGKLSRARAKATRAQAPKPAKKKSKKRSGNGFFTAVLETALEITFSNASAVKQTVVEQHNHPQPAATIAFSTSDSDRAELGEDYFEVPAADGSVAHYVTSAPRRKDWFLDPITQFDLDVGSDFDGLDNAGIDFRFQIPQSFGFDTDVTYFRESIGEFRDQSWLGDFNLVFEPIVTRNFRLRFGGGFNWLSDDVGSEFGFNLTSSMDWRLSAKWMFQAEGDIGQLGDADYAHGRIQLLRNIGGGAAVAVGYESYDISGVKLNGGFTGLQFRF